MTICSLKNWKFTRGQSSFSPRMRSYRTTAATCGVYLSTSKSEVGTVSEWVRGRDSEWVSEWEVGTVSEWEVGTVSEWEVGTVSEWEVGTVSEWEVGTVSEWVRGRDSEWVRGRDSEWVRGRDSEWRDFMCSQVIITETSIIWVWFACLV